MNKHQEEVYKTVTSLLTQRKEKLDKVLALDLEMVSLAQEIEHLKIAHALAVVEFQRLGDGPK